MVVPEIDEPFVPIPEDLLVNLSESRAVVDALLDSLPATFAGSQQVESCMGAALQAAFMVICHIGGKMLLFQAAVPTVGAGKVKNRENAALYGTDREATLRVPEDPFFKKFAAECSRVQITVDTFVFSNSYCDLASISAMPKYTCGQVYYYPGFSAQRDATKLQAELGHNLTRLTGWEAVMRIRCSKGLKISSFHGHFFIRSSDLLALPTIDPDKCFAVQISHEEAVVTGSVGYVQVRRQPVRETFYLRVRGDLLSAEVCLTVRLCAPVCTPVHQLKRGEAYSCAHPGGAHCQRHV
jgi:protein transport protein SEC24